MPNRIKRWNGEDWVTIYDEAVLTKNIFSTIQVSGQSDIVADATTDVLTLASGTGLAITTNAGTDTITFASNGTSSNTANTLVLRDGSGNFSAGGITAVGALTADGGDLRVNGAAATFRQVSFRTSGSLRWNLYANNAGESGSNAGSNLVLSRHDDAGESLGEALTIARSNGLVTVPNTFRVGGNTIGIGMIPDRGDGFSVIRHNTLTGSNDFMLSSAGTHTYVGSPSGSHIILNPGAQGANRSEFRGSGDLFVVYDNNAERMKVTAGGVVRVDKPQHDYIGQATAGATQSFASTSNSTPTFTQVQFTGADAYDYAGMHDPAANNGTRIMIPIAGVWKFHTQIPFSTQSTTGRRIVRITRYNTAAPTTILDWWEISTDPGGTVNGSTDPTFVATATMLCDAPSGGNSDFVVVEFAQSSGVSFATRYGSGVGAKCAWELIRAS